VRATYCTADWLYRVKRERGGKTVMGAEKFLEGAAAYTSNDLC